MQHFANFPRIPTFTTLLVSVCIPVLLGACANSVDLSRPTPPPPAPPIPNNAPPPVSSTTITRSSGLAIDKTYTSENQDSRVLHIVLHYTVSDFDRALRTLTQPSSRPVSSHYLVRDHPAKIYQLVDESQRAWHAGPSYWKGHTHVNSSSIGIEIVNPGLVKTAKGESFTPFPQAQINAVIALVKDIAIRHKVSPDRIVGHSDIQPQNKQDPGPMFPWKQLADAGLIPWPDSRMVSERTLAYKKTLPHMTWFQDQLADYGFNVPHNGEYDSATRNVIAAFQMKYRPTKYDGIPDAETAALLEVVNRPEGMKKPVYKVVDYFGISEKLSTENWGSQKLSTFIAIPVSPLSTEIYEL